MAMISCKECGHSISDSAEMCPSCGANNGKKKRKSKRKTSLFTWFVIAFIGYIIFANDSLRTSSSVATTAPNFQQLEDISSVPTSSAKSMNGVSSKNIRDEIIELVQVNKLVSRAAFGHDEVGGDSRYTTLWVWMSGLDGKDYDAVARHFCSIFRARNIKGAMVSIKKNGSYDTLGRGSCR